MRLILTVRENGHELLDRLPAGRLGDLFDYLNDLEGPDESLSADSDDVDQSFRSDGDQYSEVMAISNPN